MQVKSTSKVSAFLASSAGQRFQKLAGMLGSDGHGERANAAGMATELLRTAGLTWGEVMGAGPSQGGQQTRIIDLETRVRILDRHRQDDQRKIADMISQDKRQKAEINRLRRELEDALRQLRVAEQFTGTSKAEAQDFFAKADSVKMQTSGLKPGKYRNGDQPAPNQSTTRKPRKFETPFQEKLNELLDEIEEQCEMNDWESGFIASLRDLKYRITSKQYAKLEAMADNAGIDPTEFVDRP